MNRQMTILLTIISAIILSCTANVTEESMVSQLLGEGSYEFEILDSVKTTNRQVELTYAFQKAYQENVGVFNEHFEKVKNNEESNFPANEYLTEKDFDEYMEFAENIKLLPSTTENVKIKYLGDQITFESSGKLEILNYLKSRLSDL